eukprot:comp39969_c0_seq1/m.47412 comp39969_c0_seq1/g.47412  ORF comp39969_c0_seq1/g.47412 comp39969_c0_seq1/m.47412 type:complete len:257 (-) comp39969_c0_seq1:764-1534(-)
MEPEYTVINMNLPQGSFLPQSYPVFPKELLQAPTADVLQELSALATPSEPAPAKTRRTRRRHRGGADLLQPGGVLEGKRLRKAAELGDNKTVRALLEEGADPSSSDDKGRTALHLAAVAGNLRLVETLISWGADVNKRDCNGNTPLHLAAVSRRLDVMTALLKGGADARLADGRGKLAIHYAQSRLKVLFEGHAEVAREEIKQVIELLGAYMAGIGDKEAQEELESMGQDTDADLTELLANLTNLTIRHTPTLAAL